MTDIVGNLRHKAALKNLSGWGPQSQDAMRMAADEIERLRAALRDLIEAVDSELDCDNRSRAFVERLSAARTIYQQEKP